MSRIRKFLSGDNRVFSNAGDIHVDQGLVLHIDLTAPKLFPGTGVGVLELLGRDQGVELVYVWQRSIELRGRILILDLINLIEILAWAKGLALVIIGEMRSDGHWRHYGFVKLLTGIAQVWSVT